MGNDTRIEEFSKQRKIGESFLNLGIYTVLHAVYFPGCVREGRQRLYMAKYRFLTQSKLFEMTADLICEKIKYFDTPQFRQECLRVLKSNYESSRENSNFRRKINVINVAHSIESIRNLFR